MRSSFFTKNLWPIAVCGLIFTLAGCGQTESSKNDLKIYGGNQVEDGNWNSTVALTRSGRIFCSGTIVHERLVITAAHCVSSLWNPSALEIYQGLGDEGGNVRGQYQVDQIASSPKYARKLSGWDDIAYVITKEAMTIAPEHIVPILVNPDEISEVIKVGQNVRIVGFGGRDGGGYGLKYETDAPITAFTDNEVSIGRDGRDSCQGDSGGPAYAQLPSGEWRVFGVVSRGGACGNGGIWGRMNANICWIQNDSGIDLGLPDGICGEESSDTDAA